MIILIFLKKYWGPVRLERDNGPAYYSQEPAFFFDLPINICWEVQQSIPESHA